MNRILPVGKVGEKAPKSTPTLPDVPPAEEELGGGDICSLEEQPSTDDDKPLD